jgi:excisionase family DNA binding protein
MRANGPADQSIRRAGRGESTGETTSPQKLAAPKQEQSLCRTVDTTVSSDVVEEGEIDATEVSVRRETAICRNVGRVSTNDNKRALSINEAVFRYGIGRTNLYRLIKSGALKSVKLGRRRLIPVDALEALLRS